MARAAIFIDAAYLDFLMREDFPGVRIDFSKLPGALMPAGIDLLRTYYYHCPPYQSNPPTQIERDRKAAFDRFHAMLLRLPRYEVRLGVLAKRFDAGGNHRFEQKRVDILLGVDLVRLAAKGQITEAIIVAGDSDFLPAIQAAKDDGVLIRIFHGRSPHDAVLNSADESTRIDQAMIDLVRRR
jgi:uncharacterized LabA/DUF88 family protein